MAVQVRRETEQPAEPALVMRVVEPEAQALCGDCRFHVPFATKPGGWCACASAERRWQQVETGRAVAVLPPHQEPAVAVDYPTGCRKPHMVHTSRRVRIGEQ